MYQEKKDKTSDKAEKDQNPHSEKAVKAAGDEDFESRRNQSWLPGVNRDGLVNYFEVITSVFIYHSHHHGSRSPTSGRGRRVTGQGAKL
jgi:hypothetical protein